MTNDACICDGKCPGTEDRHWINCPQHKYHEGYLAMTDNTAASDLVECEDTPIELIQAETDTYDRCSVATVVRVARAICCARARCEGCQGSGEGGCFDLYLWDAEARAAIAALSALPTVDAGEADELRERLAQTIMQQDEEWKNLKAQLSAQAVEIEWLHEAVNIMHTAFAGYAQSEAQREAVQIACQALVQTEGRL